MLLASSLPATPPSANISQRTLEIHKPLKNFNECVTFSKLVYLICTFDKMKSFSKTQYVNTLLIHKNSGLCGKKRSLHDLALWQIKMARVQPNEGVQVSMQAVHRTVADCCKTLLQLQHGRLLQSPQDYQLHRHHLCQH